MLSEARRKKIKQVIASRQRDFIVVLQDIHDPHNAAAVLRTCDAFGVTAAYFIFEQEKCYNPKIMGKASSASANKWVDIKIWRSTKACVRELRESGYEIYVTTLEKGSKSLLSLKFGKRIALFFGNEHRGLSAEALGQAKVKLQIPMRGMVQSLNLSVTAAICIYEVSRQRASSGKNFSLNPKEQKRLMKKFLT